MQRARLLGAAVVTIDELGLAHTTVAHITSRARVSRRTFYDLFENREDCLIAVIDDAVALLTAQLAAAHLDSLPWRERVRSDLWGVLCFFERRHALARVCLVQSAHGGRRVLLRREEILTGVIRAIDGGRAESARAAESPPLTAEGLTGAALTIIHRRLLMHRPEPLTGLFGDLMSMIVLPYLGPAAARQERARVLPASIQPEETFQTSLAGISQGDPLRDLPMRLTYRTARVLEVLAASPGASNRLVGEQAGISDQGQVSKLLARLERVGLMQNTGQGHTKGEPNRWSLTSTGHDVTRSIASSHKNKDWEAVT